MYSRHADLPTSVTTVTTRLDLIPRMYPRQTIVIGMKCVSCATCAENLCNQTENLPSTRTRSSAMTATSLTSRRRVKDASMSLNQEARASSTMGPSGTRSASNAPSAERPSVPAVSSQKTTSSTALSATRINTPSAAPSAANRWPKAVFCTTNKHGTRSASVVTAATNPWRLARFPFTAVSVIASSVTEGFWPNSASCALSRLLEENTTRWTTRIFTKSASTAAAVNVPWPTKVSPEREWNCYVPAVPIEQRHFCR